MAITYPTTENFLNVKEAPYNAVGNGITDDTLALQAAISEALTGFFKIVYIPAGTYKISAPLRAVTNNGIVREGLKLRGAGRSLTTIKLTDNNSNYQNNESQKSVIEFNQMANGVPGTGFANYLEDITIDTGSGNSACNGIDWIGNNISSIKNVSIKSSDPNHAGATGIAMWREASGPCLIENVEIDGFYFGIASSHPEYSVVLKDLNIKNQTGAGIFVSGQVLTIDGLFSENSVPAISAEGHAFIVCLNSKFIRTSSSTLISAIETNENTHVYLYNTYSAGYSYTLKETEYNRTQPSGAIAEYSSVGNQSLHGFVNKPRLSAKIFPNLSNYGDDPNAWTYIPPTGGDDTSAIQSAFNNGKRKFYFKPGSDYWVSDSIVIPPNVEEIRGYFAHIKLANTNSFNDESNPKPLFKVETGKQMLIISEFWIAEQPLYVSGYNGCHFLWQSSQRDCFLTRIMSNGNRVVCKNPSEVYVGFPGNLLIEDCCILVSIDGQTECWAKQLNTEAQLQQTYIENKGGHVSILGLKTEGSNTILSNRDFAQTEIIGGLTYPATAVNANLPMLKNKDASLLAIFSGGAHNTDTNIYKLLVSEEIDNLSATLLKSQISYKRLWQAFFINYQQGYKTDMPFTIDSSNLTAIRTYVAPDESGPLVLGSQLKTFYGSTAPKDNTKIWVETNSNNNPKYSWYWIWDSANNRWISNILTSEASLVNVGASYHYVPIVSKIKIVSFGLEAYLATGLDILNILVFSTNQATQIDSLPELSKPAETFVSLQKTSTTVEISNSTTPVSKKTLEIHAKQSDHMTDAALYGNSFIQYQVIR